MAKFVKAAKAGGLDSAYFYTVSFVGAEVLAKELGDATSHVVVSQVMPPYAGPSTPMVDQYLAGLKKYPPEATPSFASLEAYANGNVLVAALQAAGKDLDREKFLTAIEALKESPSLPGLTFGYSATSHEGLSQVFLTSVKDGQWISITD